MIELKEILERNGWTIECLNEGTWCERYASAKKKGYDSSTYVEWEVIYHFGTEHIAIVDNRSSILDKNRIVVDALSCDSVEKINLAFKLAGIEYELNNLNV